MNFNLFRAAYSLLQVIIVRSESMFNINNNINTFLDMNYHHGDIHVLEYYEYLNYKTLKVIPSLLSLFI